MGGRGGWGPTVGCTTEPCAQAQPKSSTCAWLLCPPHTPQEQTLGALTPLESPKIQESRSLLTATAPHSHKAGRRSRSHLTAPLAGASGPNPTHARAAPA